MPILQDVSVVLFMLDGVLSVVMGLRYVTRDEFLPYQAKASQRRLSDLDPALRVLVIAMLKVIGGGFLAFGLTALGLAACLAQGFRVAGFAFCAGAAALLIPAYIASSSVARFAPQSGAPTRLTLAAGGVAALGFVCLLGA